MCIYNRILWIKMLCISPTMWYGFAQRKMRFNATENSPNNKWVQPSYTTNSAWNITDHQQSTSPDTAERPENWSPWIQNWLEKWFSKDYVILQVLFVLFVRFLVSTNQSSPKMFLVSGGGVSGFFSVPSGWNRIDCVTEWNHHRHGITMES